MSGFICILVGIAVGVISFTGGSNAETIMQQIVQYLGFICASIFIVGGLILVKLDKRNKI